MKTLKEYHDIQDTFREANNKMSFRQYEALSEGWNLDKVFDMRIRVAILNSRSEAEIPLKHICNKELRWMAKNRRTLNIKGKKGVMKL